MTTTYNGWTNYATWAVNLHIDNEQGSQEYWAERASAALEDSDFDIDDAVSLLADHLQSDHEEAMPEVTGVFADLLGAALGDVEWREIARNMLQDIEVYSAGWNMPGYMPDSEPARFLSDSDARCYISDEMDNAAEQEEDEEKREAIESASLAVLRGSGEYGATVGEYHYFVTRV
jgi:hypothetical protein